VDRTGVDMLDFNHGHKLTECNNLEEVEYFLKYRPGHHTMWLAGTKEHTLASCCFCAVEYSMKDGAKPLVYLPCDVCRDLVLTSCDSFNSCYKDFVSYYTQISMLVDNKVITLCRSADCKEKFKTFPSSYGTEFWSKEKCHTKALTMLPPTINTSI